MQACPDNSDYREKQCSTFNDIPYKGDQMTWKAYYHPQEPCSLYCVNQYNDVELLATKVHDGTRCRPGSLDMCIDGKCMVSGSMISSDRVSEIVRRIDGEIFPTACRVRPRNWIFENGGQLRYMRR